MHCYDYFLDCAEGQLKWLIFQTSSDALHNLFPNFEEILYGTTEVKIKTHWWSEVKWKCCWPERKDDCRVDSKSTSQSRIDRVFAFFSRVNWIFVSVSRRDSLDVKAYNLNTR